MFDRIDELVRTYDELTAALADPAVLADPARYRATAKRQAELSEVVDTYQRYRRLRDDAATARELAGQAGAEDRELFRAEAAESDGQADTLAERLKVLLLPHDPLDDKDVIVEIRAGA